MQHFQSVLIVVGVIAIASVLIHGYMISRKEKAAMLEQERLNNPTNENSDTGIEQNDMSFSNDNDINDEEYIDFSDALADEKEVPVVGGDKKTIKPKDKGLDDFFNSETVKKNIVSFSFNKSKNKKNKKDNTLAEELPVEEQSDIVPPAEDNLDKVKTEATEQVAEKIEIVEEQIDQQAEVIQAEPSEVKEQAPEQPETEFFIVHVATKEGKEIGGLQLLQFFLTSGFRHGEMSFFHRHLEPDGTGPIMFTIANTLAPGTFEADQMEKLSTEGVSFFINAPKPDVDMKAAFDMMFTAVGQLAEEFDCDILNQDRQPFSQEDFIAYDERLKRYL